MKTTMTQVLFISLFLQYSILGQAQIITVPLGNSIQTEIDNATDGDTILVEEGVFDERLIIKDKNIVLASKFLMTGEEIDKENTIITSTDENTIYFGKGNKSLLIGFTITNNAISGLGRNILCDTAAPIIIHNIILDGRAKGNPVFPKQYGGGIFINKGNPIIAHNRIANNYAWRNGGGIAVNYGSPQIVNNIITGNKANRAGAIYCFKSTAIITGNIMDRDTSEQGPGGGGIIIDQGFDEVLLNTIVKNHNIENDGKGAGIFIAPKSFAKIKYNIISKNFTPSEGRGAGLFCSDIDSLFVCPDSIFPNTSNTQIQHNFFFDNIRQNALAADDIYLEGVFDTLNNSFLVDPLFVDFDNQNYELVDDSPASDLGYTGDSPYILDFDKDGRTDLEEISMAPITNPLRSDTDNDGALDWEEIHVYDTQPLLEDSDTDLHNDGFEIQMGTDPNDPMDFPETIKQVTFDTLIHQAMMLSQAPFSNDTIPLVPMLDFPQYGQENEIGLVFNELSKITAQTPLDSGFLFFPLRPRGSLDSVPIIVYADHDNDQFYDIVPYDDLNANYDGMCPPIDKELMPIAGKTISRFEMGAQQANNDFPTLATFSATGYGRLLPYVGRDEQVYGVSHRATTHFLGDTLVDEKFPRFKEVYLNIVDSLSGRAMATIDGEAFSGAVNYLFTPGEVSELKVKAHFFPRDTLKENTFGVLGMSSMFWKDENSTPGDSMDEAHDSDLLIVGDDLNGDGVIDLIDEKALENPGVCNVQIETDFDSLSEGKQVYFALEQRDRDSVHYQKFKFAKYHLRPSYSISVISSNVPLALKLFEFGTDGEFFDNIALAFILKEDIPPNEPIVIEYVLRAYFPNDTDGDGLNDHLENLIGTCIDDADTDNDSISDHQELKDGTNPRAGIEIQALPPAPINAGINEIVEATVQLTNLANCLVSTPIIGISLQNNNEFTIDDTVGDFSECPYLISHDGTFGLNINFVSPLEGQFFDTLIVTFIDTILQIPLTATVIIVGANKIENNHSVKVFPNPSNGNTTLFLKGWEGEIKIKVVDIHGRVIKQMKESRSNQRETEIQINGIPKGSYYIELSNEQFHAIKKLVIQ